MIDARYIDTQRPCHKTSHHMRIFAVKRRQLRSTLTPCCTVFRSLPLPACFTCVSPGVMVSLTVLWFSSREHVKRLSKEHMEAKAEDHIRDIRTDAEIKQMDIEEAVPWLQFFQLRSYFSLWNSIQNWPRSRFHKISLNWGNGILGGTCQGICGGDSCSSLWPAVGWSTWRCVETNLRCRPIIWLLMPSRAGPRSTGCLQKGTMNTLGQAEPWLGKSPSD